MNRSIIITYIHTHTHAHAPCSKKRTMRSSFVFCTYRATLTKRSSLVERGRNFHLHTHHTLSCTYAHIRSPRGLWGLVIYHEVFLRVLCISCDAHEAIVTGRKRKNFRLQRMEHIIERTLLQTVVTRSKQNDRCGFQIIQRIKN